MKKIDENNRKAINLKKGDRMIVNLTLSGDIEFESNNYKLFRLFKVDHEIMKLRGLMIDEYERIDGDNTININFKYSSESTDTGEDIISKSEIKRTRDFNGNTTDQLFKVTEIKNKKGDFISYRSVETLEDGIKINDIGTYDSTGNLLTRRYAKGSSECYTFRRNDNGVISENYNDETTKTSKIYTTRENDATEEIVVHSKEGDNTIRTEIHLDYIYDNNNRLVCILTENNGGKKICTQSIIRDPNGNILASSVYDNTGNLLNVYKYERSSDLMSIYREFTITKYESVVNKDIICKKFRLDNMNRLIRLSSNSYNKFIEARYKTYRGNCITEIKCRNRGFDRDTDNKDMEMKIVIDGNGNERTEVFINTADSNKPSPLLIFTRERTILGKQAMSFREECFADINTSMMHDINLMYNEYNLSYNNYNRIIFDESSFYHIPHEIRGY